MQEVGAYQLFKNLNEFNLMRYLVIDYNIFEVHKMSTFSSFVSKTRL